VAVDDRDPLGAQQRGLLLVEPGHEPALGRHHAPPRDVLIRHPQQVADGTRRVREPGVVRDLAVGHHLTGLQVPEHGEHTPLERRHRVRARGRGSR
jgi:hypothetical protein